MKIGIIIGSTRPERRGAAVGQWVHEIASARDDAEYELVDLESFQLELLDEPIVPGAANRQYESPQTTAWSKKIDSLDAFVFVTPEYNHGVPAALKNAVDVIYPEWNNKAITYVSYGADKGVRAVEQWRTITANALLHSTRAQVSMSTFDDWSDGVFDPDAMYVDALNGALDQLVALAGAVKTLR
ncbi:NADPH-dependent FMN reductase [Microlunatus sp. Y2014]|uniref:NADPH-dependent FMN reductase n=1 Tax=Microlunatus sp. Y2014 TaxID=3418488 RepID=UPI003DA76DF4